MRYQKLTKEYDRVLANLIRHSLKTHSLDIPGTVYFDEGLDHLSDYYSSEPDKRYYAILLNDEGVLIGGIGLAEFDASSHCAELQKLYLSDDVKGQGLGYRLIEYIEQKAGELDYERMYLETHTNLQAAIHIYEKSGYHRIEQPDTVVHSAMDRFYMKNL